MLRNIVLEVELSGCRRGVLLGSRVPVRGDAIQWVLKESFPERPLGLKEIEASRISGQSTREGGNFVNLMHLPSLPPPLPQEIPLVLVFVRGYVDPVRIN
jgi:hypothetical protein